MKTVKLILHYTIDLKEFYARKNIFKNKFSKNVIVYLFFIYEDFNFVSHI